MLYNVKCYVKWIRKKDVVGMLIIVKFFKFVFKKNDDSDKFVEIKGYGDES